MMPLPSEEYNRAKTIAYRLLKIRQRSSQEIEDRLKKFYITRKTTNLILKEFKENNLIDDRRFAKDWINARLAKPLGLRKIKSELEQKGISDQIIQEELFSQEFIHNDHLLAEDLAKQRALKLKSMDATTMKRRVFAFLSRRGFDQDTIENAVERLS